MFFTPFKMHLVSHGMDGSTYHEESCKELGSFETPMFVGFSEIWFQFKHMVLKHMFKIFYYFYHYIFSIKITPCESPNISLTLRSLRHADIRSHPGHYLADPYTWHWSPNGHDHGHEWPTPTPLFNVNQLSHSEIHLFQKFTMKILGQGHVCGQRSMSHLTLKIQRSMSWPRSNQLVKFEALRSSIDMFAYRSVANETIFGGGIVNSISDLENSRPRSWPRSNPMVTFEA